MTRTWVDQIIQTIFFKALKAKIVDSILAEYIMNDDDAKYYNAWTKVMRTGKKRLLGLL